jgi:hypothetical protein
MARQKRTFRQGQAGLSPAFDENRANNPQPAEERNPEAKPFRHADPEDSLLSGVAVNPSDPAQGYDAHVAAKLSTKK